MNIPAPTKLDEVLPPCAVVISCARPAFAECCCLLDDLDSRLCRSGSFRSRSRRRCGWLRSRWDLAHSSHAARAGCSARCCWLSPTDSLRGIKVALLAHLRDDLGDIAHSIRAAACRHSDQCHDEHQSRAQSNVGLQRTGSWGRRARIFSTSPTSFPGAQWGQYQLPSGTAASGGVRQSRWYTRGHASQHNSSFSVPSLPQTEQS